MVIQATVRDEGDEGGSMAVIAFHSVAQDVIGAVSDQAEPVTDRELLKVIGAASQALMAAKQEMVRRNPLTPR